jgi:hypothetical protein
MTKKKQDQHDASIEEIFHLITQFGYSKVYLEIFGESNESTSLLFSPKSLSFKVIVELSSTVLLSLLIELSLPLQLDRISNNIE